MRGRLSAAAVTLAVVAMQLAPAHAATDHIFKFSGDCTDCTGKATATLVLTNYDFGADMYGSFVSFTYDKSSLIDSFTMTSSFGNEGGIGAATGSYDAFFYGTGSRTFRTDRFGNWETGYGNGAPLDYGTGGIWSLADPISSGVPEVAAWTMMMAGFGAIGATLRRKRVSFA